MGGKEETRWGLVVVHLDNKGKYGPVEVIRGRREPNSAYILFSPLSYSLDQAPKVNYYHPVPGREGSDQLWQWMNISDYYYYFVCFYCCLLSGCAESIKRLYQTTSLVMNLLHSDPLCVRDKEKRVRVCVFVIGLRGSWCTPNHTDLSSIFDSL